MMGLEYLYFRGWIPGVAWGDAPEDAFNYAYATPAQVTAGAAAFARDAKRYAIPFLDSVASPKDGARFFTARSAPTAAGGGVVGAASTSTFTALDALSRS